MDFFKENKKYLLWLSLLFIMFTTFLWLKQGLIYIDTGREFYIPWQMLKGQLLYRDIFNIYGPLGYQINALAFILFGQKIQTLYMFGVVNSAFILFLLFSIAKEFLSGKLSFLITIFVMISGVFSLGLFNFNIPYSYSMSYAFSMFLASLFFLIKFIKTDSSEKNKLSLFSSLSCLFSGMWIVTKYEYLLCLIVFLWALNFVKPFDKKRVLLNITAFCIVPIISISTLLIQGVSFTDLINASQIASKMASVPSLIYFYKSVCIYFSPKTFALGAYCTFVFCTVYFCYFKILSMKLSTKMPILHKILLILFSIFAFLITFNLNMKLFAAFAVINLLLLIAFMPRIYKNKALFVLSFSAFFSTIKTFFYVSVSIYGAFAIPILIVSIISLLRYLLKDKNDENIIKIFSETTIFFLSIFIFIAMIQINLGIQYKSHLLKTPKGSIYINSFLADSHEGLIKYIKQNLKPTDKMVILPETPFINFVMNVDSDNYYNSLIPMYFETFGEKNIINHFKKVKPEYIVINTRDTSEYGAKHICEDYAFEFCSYVKQDYAFDKMVGNNAYAMLIMKRKDLKL